MVGTGYGPLAGPLAPGSAVLLCLCVLQIGALPENTPPHLTWRPSFTCHTVTLLL